jgi:hypothetical protein
MGLWIKFLMDGLSFLTDIENLWEIHEEEFLIVLVTIIM